MTNAVHVREMPPVQVWPIPVPELQGSVMVASLHVCPEERDLAIVMVTGGRQTRAGSHRQYLRLARHFAEKGFSCLRFDLPGQGDASGEANDFESNRDALRAAIDALQAHLPSAKRIVLWGLCDGATLAALYAPSDSRVSGLVLVNPWVRTLQVQSQALLKTYYRQRLMSPAFWTKFMRGRVGVAASVREWLGNFRKARSSMSAKQEDLPARVFGALDDFAGTVRIVIGGGDLTGKEFMLAMSQRAIAPKFDVHTVEGADHTFSQLVWHQELALSSLDAINAL